MIRIFLAEDVLKKLIQSDFGTADSDEEDEEDEFDDGRECPFECDDVDEIVFEGKIFVLTGHDGKTEEKITGIINERGGEVNSSTVLKTDYLIVNENYEHDATTKYNRALELREKGKNIMIVGSERFFELANK